MMKLSIGNDAFISEKSQLARVVCRQLRKNNIALGNKAIDSYKFTQIGNDIIELKIYDSSEDCTYYFDHNLKTNKVVFAYLEPSKVAEIPYGVTELDVIEFE